MDDESLSYLFINFSEETNLQYCVVAFWTKLLPAWKAYSNILKKSHDARSAARPKRRQIPITESIIFFFLGVGQVLFIIIDRTARRCGLSATRT